MDPFQLLLVSAIVLFVWLIFKKPSNLPPGPLGIPLVGHLPFLLDASYISLRDIGKKYGSLFTIKLGQKYVIVLNDWKAIKEALLVQTDIFSGRPETIIFNDIRRRTDITGSDGPEWKERRTFTTKTLRSLGFRDLYMEALITVEVEKLIEKFTLFHLDKRTVIDELFFLHFLNVMWGVVASKKFDIDDEKNEQFAIALKHISMLNSNSTALQFMPFLRFIPGLNQNYLTFLDTNKRAMKFIEDEVDEHLNSFTEGNVSSFVDAYLDEMFRQQKQQGVTPTFQKKYLVGIMYNLFNGGVDTGNNTLLWAILYMACWPEIQRKVQEELDVVIGRARLPKWSDKPNLPYTDAVCCEVQRFSTVGPLGFPHCAMKTANVLGQTVLKGVHILANIWAVHNDPDYWGDPEIFRPERFLNDKGQVERPEYLIPFLVGRRSCIGEALAKMEVYLYLSSLLQHFTFSLPSGEPFPSMEPIVGLTVRPRPYAVIIRQR